MRSIVVAFMLTAVVLAGCANQADDTDSSPPAEPAEKPFVPRVVVGILDTGIQPYHEEFRQVRDGEDPYAHPSTYLTGYPEDAKGLKITLELDSKDAEDYLEADRDLWEGTSQGTLYYLPGTKFIGVVGMGADLPGGGHGTMTSSRAGGNTVSIGGNETLLVHVRTGLTLSTSIEEDDLARATRWMADQPYLDIQSHSWGWFAMCAGVAGSQAWGWADAFKYARDKQPVFVAAANGWGNGGLGYPSQCQDNAGIAGVVTVGGEDNGGIVRWANWFPAVVADGCRNPAAAESTTDELSNTGGGTSSATPFSAGGAAKLVLEARRIFHDPNVGVRDGVMAEIHEGGTIPEKGPLSDGKFTMDELKEVLFHTAVVPEDNDSDGDACLGTSIPVPPGATPESTWPFFGYGEVNRNSIDAGLAVLRGETDLEDRMVQDALYENDQTFRRAFWG